MNPLICPQCGEYRFIRMRLLLFGKEPRAFTMRMPFYICDACTIGPESIVPLDGQRINDFKNFLLAEIDDGPTVEVTFKHLFAEIDVTARFKRYEHLGFDYDTLDHYFIPGLVRSPVDGYLTPVFFEKDLLVYYNNHPDYSVLLYSFSSGTIYHKGSSILNYGFGINRGGKIFTWLGDLDRDLDGEEMTRDLRRFQASNTESDHDIVSTFYFSQIPFTPDELFPDSDNEVRVFQLKNQFDQKVNKLFGVGISKINVDRLPDYYRTPILNDREQILDAYLKLDQYLIETIQKPELQSILLQKGISQEDIQQLGGIKLMEKFSQVVLNIADISTFISPLYVLHDLRNLKGHLAQASYTERYNSCKLRLGVALDTTYYDFFKILIQRLIKMYQQLLGAANAIAD
jgi:hypothetical protein